MNVKFKKLHPDAVMPSYSKSGDAGMDLTAISLETKITKTGILNIYDTGIALEIPEGYVGLVFPRSSAATKTSLILGNSVGVIDSGFRSSIKFVYRETAVAKGTRYEVGDRIGQIIILPYPKIELQEVDELSESERGESGWGSTGN